MGWYADGKLDWPLDWYGIDGDPTMFDGYGPSGVYTLMLDLQVGFTVRWGWLTDIIKTRSGLEQRISRNDSPKQSYSGDALLFDDNPRTIRAKLARYAAIGSQFLLGLPHEELTIRASSSGTTVYVHAGALALVDWAKPGQRVVLARAGASLDAVIQSTTSNTIELDVTPGALGLVGGRIMPAMAVYLEPQQNFARYPTNAERWNLDARAAIFDFAPTKASLALGPITVSAAFDGVILVARPDGLAGNSITVALTGDALFPPMGGLSESGLVTTVLFRPGVTTLANLEAVLLLSSNVLMTGTWTGADTIAAGDAFAATSLAGGANGAVGTGATVTTYDGHPVWDRRLSNKSTAQDSVHAMTEILDFGGVPYAIGTADEADWGRAVGFDANGVNAMAEYQWLKLFLSTVKGRQKAFWLPTWRDDMTFVSKAANTITISDTDGSDFFAWWPAQRQHIQIWEADGTITYAEVTAAVDNGATITLTIGTTLASSDVTMVSWLELCRFESDDFELQCDAAHYAMSTVARVVQG